MESWERGYLYVILVLAVIPSTLSPTIQAVAAASDEFLAYKTASIVYKQATKAIPSERTSFPGDGGGNRNGTRELPTDYHFGVI